MNIRKISLVLLMLLPIFAIAGNGVIVDSLPAERASEANNTSFRAYSKFDFIPGEKIIYSEDFSQDAVGELPLKWNTSGKGEVVTLEGFSGKWLRMFQNSLYLSSSTKPFTKNFTVEFDMILQFNYKSYTLPLVTVGLLSSGKDESTDNKFLTSQAIYASAHLQLRPYNNATSSLSFISYLERAEYFKSADQSFPSLEKSYNKVMHIAMQAQETRLRIWINNEKIYDVPRGIATQHEFNQIFFKIHTSGYKDDQIGFFVNNLRVATGVADTRHKLLEEGKFSTNAIQFDVQSSVIKPESYGIIKQIGNVLKENEDVKIRIVGYTSSDGDDKSNLELSKSRAAAVKDVLVKSFEIDAARIVTEGKGEAEPVGDNKTKEGRMLNRRVAFIKVSK